jgi:extracellular elastinolytic metalloproteinase
MGREVDRRDFSENRVTPDREAELRSLAMEVSRRLEGPQRVTISEFDPTTGNPKQVLSESARPEKGNYVQRALGHLKNISSALGLAAAQPVEFAADPNVQETSSGAVAVHLQQQYKGIRIFQAAETVRFAPDGTLTETAGRSITVAQERDVAPIISVQQAVLKAAQHVAVPQPDEEGQADQFGQPMKPVGVDLTAFVPKVIATFTDKADQPTVLEAGPFGDEIKAALIWFPLGDDLRLAWEAILTMPNYEGQYRTVVDARTEEILYCRQLIPAVAARGNVYHPDGSGARQVTEFPRALQDYGLPVPVNLPNGFPDLWVSGDSTEGNCVRAHLGDSGPPVRGVAQGDFLTFDPADPNGDDQKVLNIFYLNCFIHDFFYLLGFREADGNFQRSNFDRGGIQADGVDARSYAGPVWGTASMGTPVDGSSPVMKMGLVASTSRHTAFDSSVVFHEFMHGVTNRLVGGPLNVSALEEPQSEGMGEGWGDYIACTINKSTVVGAWVVNRPGGIRAYPYDANFPDNFGHLGTGRYAEEHNIGEIWCATLLEMNRNIGSTLGVQLVVDALKLSPANPSFLDVRDAILAALNNKLVAGQLSAGEHGAAKTGIWKAFAKFGMGPAARSNGASLSGIVADFRVPAEAPGPGVRIETAPALAIPDNRRTGVKSVLTVQESGRIARVAVSVDIVHPYVGDLRVTLKGPKGRTVVLHDRAGEDADDLVRTYASEDVPGLAALVGREARGDWTLRVADLAADDTGTLKKWRLELDFQNGVG